MTMSLLLEHFDNLLITPENAEQLNRAILQLAMQGKLVKQSAQDGQASELLKLIAIKKGQDIESVDDDNAPFALPKNWAWSRLSGIGSWANGSGFPLSYQGLDGLPYLYCKVSDMNLPGNEIRIHHTQNTIDENIASKIKAKIHPVGTVIFPKIGGAIATNKRRILAVPAAIDNNCLGIDPLGYCSSEWLHLLLSSIDFMQYQTGTSIPAINQGVLGNIVVGVPPLAEQQRIVARAEELFAQTRALAKELDRSQIELEGLNKSALSHLLASKTPEEFNQHWDFIAEHFDLLFQTPEHVAPLRQSILELAVRGKLTRREAGDESAGELLKRIRDEKVGIGKEKLSTPIEDDERPVELPQGWEWVKLNEIILGIEAGQSFLAEGRPAQDREFGVLKVSAVTWGEFDPQENKALLPGTSYRNEFLVKANDLLITRANTAELVGAVVLVDKDYPNLLLSDKTLRLNCASEVFKPFLLLALRAPWVRAAFGDQAIGTSSSMRNISQDKIRSALIAFPPLAEQERIVKRVEQLLSLCDALEARLQSAEEERGRLVSAVMSTVGG